MRTCLECVPCFLRQALDASRAVTSDPGVHEKVMRETLRLAAGMQFGHPPPWMGQRIHRLLRQATGNCDPYREAKRRSNAAALELYPAMKARVDASADPFATAVHLAIAGNVIDLGCRTEIDDGDVHRAIEEALTAPVDPHEIHALRQAVQEAEAILYLADNAGEIVFDRLLIEAMPMDRTTLVVRGGPIINDATREDAEAAGLTALVEVIDNGADVPGTILDQCSAAFRRRFEDADLIIAKGQGNYETLSQECLGDGQTVFFLLKVKCAVIARDLRCRIGEMVVRKDQATSQSRVSCSCDDFDWMAEEAHS
ncbi:MAG: damage-control phosphatase ARMT1 family protein [Phycisphaerae bacterium]